MSASFDVAGVGNAIVDIIAPASEAFLEGEGLEKGGMILVDQDRATALYANMAPGIEASGGSAANTLAGLASFGGRAAFMGKVAEDQLGEVFAHDIRAIGVEFHTPMLANGSGTGRCMVNVTSDGQRTMTTFLGAAAQLSPEDVDPQTVAAAEIVYLEGYLFDPEPARAALHKAATVARDAGRKVALTLSDAFVVDRWRDDLLAFIEADVDLLFANAAELASLFRLGTFDAGVAELRRHVPMAAVTHGPEGSVVFRGDEIVRVNADPIDKVVDTTGAGDQYAAGFLFGLSRGRPLADCGALGSLAAAEVISHYGPRPQTPFADLARSRGLA